MDTRIESGCDGRGRCPAEATLLVISGRWKIPILWQLSHGTMRFSQLRREMGRITPKMLAQQLRELEADGVVRRHVHAQVPPRVDYTLTARGRTLGPIVEAMCKWGKSRRGR